jgi:hypothetical protein
MVEMGEDSLFEDDVVAGNKRGKEVSCVEESEDEEELVVELSVEFSEFGDAGVLVEILVD